MRRRDFTIGLMLGAAVRQVRSQENGLAVIGFLSSNAPGTFTPAVAAFRQGLAETGYIEGKMSQSNTAGRRAITTGCPH